MAEFNKYGGGGKRFGAAGGGRSFSGGRPSFGKKPWGNRPTNDGTPAQRYQATCSNCGKETDVPFRPVSGKPIYCRDCFKKTAGAPERVPHTYARKEFTPRDTAPRIEHSPHSDIVAQLETLNAKLERLIRAVETASTPRTEQ